jgi:hypothetical protein
MNRWVAVYDFASLYQQHSYNFIAPETFIGVEDTKNKGFCTNGREIDISKHVYV